MKKEIAIIGLGKMGANLAKNLLGHDWKVIGYNRNEAPTKLLEGEGLEGAYSYKECIEKLTTPRLVWLMVPSGVVSDLINDVSDLLEEGDILIDGGNSMYTKTIEHHQLLENKGILFLDSGVSGGPGGALEGACCMVGGNQSVFDQVEPLFKDLCVEGGYQFFPGEGAGHFVKMVHNGIEYGMMQALAEGFAMMKNSEFNLDLIKVAGVYGHGSVIESRLVDWLKEGYEKFGTELEEACGSASHLGEGQWTVEKAKSMGIDIPVIEAAFAYRLRTSENPDYIGKILMTLRHGFGKHEIKCEE